MPLYEYECTSCHRHTEKIQKFSDPEITACPHCGGELKRVISAPAFSLKGGGWYADGYGSQKPAATMSEGGSGDKAESAAPAKDGSAKPAATPAAASTPAPSAPAAAPAAGSSSSSGDKK